MLFKASAWREAKKDLKERSYRRLLSSRVFREKEEKSHEYRELPVTVRGRLAELHAAINNVRRCSENLAAACMEERSECKLEMVRTMFELGLDQDHISIGSDERAQRLAITVGSDYTRWLVRMWMIPLRILQAARYYSEPEPMASDMPTDWR